MTVGHRAEQTHAIYAVNHLLCGGIVFAGAAICAGQFGLTNADLLAGHPAIALVNMIALAVMVWPVISLTVTRLHERQAERLWGAPFWPIAALAIMAVNFNKPAMVSAEPGLLQLAPSILTGLLVAWVIGECVYDRLRARSGWTEVSNGAPAPAALA